MPNASSSALAPYQGASSPVLAATLKNSTALSAALGPNTTRLRGVIEASGLLAEANAKFAAGLSPKLLEAAKKHLASRTLAGSLGPKVTKMVEKHLARTAIAGMNASTVASIEKALSARLASSLGGELQRQAAQAMPGAGISAFLGEKDLKALEVAAGIRADKLGGSTNLGSTLGAMDFESVRADLAKVQRALPADLRMATSKKVSPPDWLRSEGVGEMLGNRAVVVGREDPQPREMDDLTPAAYNPLVSLEPAGHELLISAEPVSVGEEIAARVLREQKEEVVAFLEDCGLGQEVAELEAVESRLHQRSQRDREHAAFAARLLLKAVADRVFPPQASPWVDPQGIEHDVGPEKVANRLSAFVHEHLRADLDKHERCAFQGDLDTVANWTGGGPHGVHSTYAAEIAFGRLMNILVHVARAYRASPGH